MYENQKHVVKNMSKVHQKYEKQEKIVSRTFFKLAIIDFKNMKFSEAFSYKQHDQA